MRRSLLLSCGLAVAGCGAASYDDGAEAPIEGSAPRERPDVWLVAASRGDIDHPLPRRERWEVVEIRVLGMESGVAPDRLRLVLDGVPLPTEGLGGSEPVHVALPGSDHELELVVDDQRGRAPIRGALRFETSSPCRTLLDARLPARGAGRDVRFTLRSECAAGYTTAGR